MFRVLQIQGYEQIFSGSCKFIQRGYRHQFHLKILFSLCYTTCSFTFIGKFELLKISIETFSCLTAIAGVMNKYSDNRITQIFIFIITGEYKILTDYC